MTYFNVYDAYFLLSYYFYLMYMSAFLSYTSFKMDLLYNLLSISFFSSYFLPLCFSLHSFLSICLIYSIVIFLYTPLSNFLRLSVYFDNHTLYIHFIDYLSSFWYSIYVIEYISWIVLDSIRILENVFIEFLLR